MHNYGGVTADRVRELALAGESYTVEFKRGRKTSLSDQDILKAVICLANGSGGTLLLGVEDDGSITGLEPRHGDITEARLLRAMILNNTDAPVPVDVDIVGVDGLAVALVEVPDSPAPVGTTSGTYLRRALRVDGRPECVPYRAHEMVSAGLTSQGRDYAQIPARGARLTDLDPQEFARLRRLCATGKGDRVLAEASDEEILRGLRLVLPEMGNQLTVGAVLLFGTEAALAEHVPTAEALFHETRRGRLTASESLRQPLFKTAEKLHDLVAARNSEEELIAGMLRIAVPRIADQTIRESIANALVHRDYAELGPVAVTLSDDQLRVSSPGGFPPGITLLNLVDDSRPRSPVLAEAFRRAGFVDRAGRGVKEMFDALLRSGRAGPDYSATNDKAVVVSIPTSDADLELVQFIVTYEETTGDRLTLLQLRVLHEVKTMGPETLAELEEALHQPSGTVRSQTTRLIEAGLLEPRGQGRHRRHHLTAAFHRAAESASYIRLRDTDPIQQEHMVLSYVESFGSITRGKAAELCRLSPQQARGVLKRLVDAGALVLVGERRGAYYVRPRASRRPEREKRALEPPDRAPG